MTSQISLRVAGVHLLLAVDDALAEVIHWGGDLGALDAQSVASIIDTHRPPVAPNAPDESLRVGVLPELRLGWTGRPGLIGSRDGRDWTPDFTVGEVRLDGVPTTGFVDARSGVVEVDASAPGLDLTLVVQLLDSGLVRLRAHLTNTADDPYRVDELSLALPVPNQARELLDFAGRWGAERAPQRMPFAVGQHRRDGRHGRTGADASYVLHAGVPGFGYRTGEVWAVHTAWSGNHVTYAERDASGTQVLGGGELLLSGEGRLGRGETYSTPWLYGAHGHGLDAIARRFHEHVRALPVHPDAQRPVTINVWEAVYFDQDAARLIDLADRAAALGVERFVLDDGWFGGRRDDHAGLGDWVVSRQVWPEGLHPLVDHVKGLGMQFGLWFEPEMVNPDSDVARAHPDWIMQPQGRWPIESRHQQVMNLAIPEAFAHVRDQMLALFDAYAIDYVKWDHNRDLIDAGTPPRGRPGVSAQTHAFYRLLDELRAAHPEIEFESCSSGGSRIDLEVIERVERVWVSDNIDPEERQRMLWWTAQLLPTELMGSHIASGRSHTTGRWHDLEFRAMTAVFGHLGIEWDLAQASDDELASLEWWIGWYKANREVLCTGELVRVDMPDPDVFFKGIITPGKAIFSLSMLRVTTCSSLGRLRFPGLDPDARYRVTLVDHQPVPPTHWVAWRTRPEPVRMSGRALAEAGVRAPHLLPCSAVLFELDREA